MSITHEPELERLLKLVIQKTQRERTAQIALDAAETEYITNPSKDEAVHDQLRDSVKTRRRALKHDRLLAEAATDEALEYLNTQEN